ncbi:NAD-glutamate dehydrogenase, partial [Georgenia satyanarayanai]|nr:NAD-glutamate dehydrogenase [Georgenia satyanarayanai]
HIDIDSLLPSLEEQLNKSMQGWEDEARQVFADELGEAQGTQLADNYLRSIPLAYQEDYTPRVALQDLKRLDSIATQQALPMRWYLYQKTNEPPKTCTSKCMANRNLPPCHTFCQFWKTLA